MMLAACSGGDDDDDKPDPDPPAQVEGSLLRTTATSGVAVVLDEIPRSMRNRVAKSLLAADEEFWVERAKRQLVMTTYRLVFRDAFYGKNRFSLPLPPPELWEISLAGEPRRARIDGHDVVGLRYEFNSVPRRARSHQARPSPTCGRLAERESSGSCCRSTRSC